MLSQLGITTLPVKGADTLNRAFKAFEGVDVQPTSHGVWLTHPDTTRIYLSTLQLLATLAVREATWGSLVRASEGLISQAGRRACERADEECTPACTHEPPRTPIHQAILEALRAQMATVEALIASSSHADHLSMVDKGIVVIDGICVDLTGVVLPQATRVVRFARRRQQRGVGSRMT